MKNWERKLVLGGLGVAGFVFLIAAIRPVLTGLPLNVTFLLVGLACLVIGVIAWRKPDASAGP